MKSLILTSLNVTGEEALRKQFRNYKKMNSLKKKIFKKFGYTIEELTEKPYTLNFTINNPKFEEPHNLASIRYEITSSLEDEGALEDQDYNLQEK